MGIMENKMETAILLLALSHAFDWPRFSSESLRADREVVKCALQQDGQARLAL